MKRYENEFKEMIVGFLNSGMQAKQVAKDYKLNASMIGRWKREYKDRKGDFSKKKELSASEKELKALKKELKEITIERDILKKALSIFSKSDK